MGKILLLMAIIVFGGISNSFSQEVPFTKEDRDRLIRLETKFEEGQKAINQRFDGVDQRFNDINKRIDDLREEMRALRTFML